MKKRIWPAFKFLLLVSGVALIVRADLESAKTGLRIRPTSSELADVISDADLTAFREKPVPHYPGIITDEGIPLKTAALATAQVEPVFKGFVDEINTLVSVDETGRIRGARILSHRETPYYMRMILDSDLLDEFMNRNIKDGLEGIDAVTGATVTSRAIIDDIKAGSRTAGREIHGIEVQETHDHSLADILIVPNFIILVLVLVIGLLARYVRLPRWGRDAVYVLSIITIGFWLNTPYALVHTFQFASLNWPGFSNPGLVVLGIFILATTLLGGPLYCGYVCPFGGMQDLLFRFSPRSWHWQVSPKVLKVARELRYIILFICVLGFFGLGINAFSEIEPFSHLFALTISFAPWLLIVACLIISLFVRRFWCRFFCPTGACLVMLSAHRRYFRQIEKGLRSSEIDPAAQDHENEEQTPVQPSG